VTTELHSQPRNDRVLDSGNKSANNDTFNTRELYRDLPSLNQTNRANEDLTREGNLPNIKIAEAGRHTLSPAWRDSVTDTGRGSITDTGRGSVTDTGRGSITDTGRGSVTDTGRGSVTDTGRGSITDTGRGSITDSGRGSITDTGRGSINDRGNSVSDRGIERPKPAEKPDVPARAFTMDLKNHAANHGKPDALVYLPRNFDPEKPINLVIYNHGWRSTATSSYKNERLGDQMTGAPPNTVLVIPEWQRNPGAENGDQGALAGQGKYAAMLQEIMNKTPGLKGKNISDLESINIVSHSAGYNPTTKMIYDPTIGPKVKSLTMLDSAYNGPALNGWLAKNARELASGEKQFINIFNDTTKESLAQAKFVKETLGKAGLSPALVQEDYKNGKRPISKETVGANGIIFKRSDLTTGGSGAHGAMPKLFFSTVLEGANLRRQRGR